MEDDIEWIEQIIEDGGLRLATQNDLTDFLSALRSFAAMARFSFDDAVRDSDRGAITGSPYGAAHASRYTGWDRIHDDNKAEGRPVGNQWSDAGVDYGSGYKVYR